LIRYQRLALARLFSLFQGGAKSEQEGSYLIFYEYFLTILPLLLSILLSEASLSDFLRQRNKAGSAISLFLFPQVKRCWLTPGGVSAGAIWIFGGYITAD